MKKNAAEAAGASAEKLVQPVGNPIICSPYTEPAEHWYYQPDGVPITAPGRRTASYWYKFKKGFSSQRSLFAEEESEPLPLVNLLRDDVRRWRASGYESATPVTKQLLEFWKNPQRERRLFFCQLEAVETIIYLNEILRSGRKPRFSPKLSVADFEKLLRGERPDFVSGLDVSADLLPRLVDFPFDENAYKPLPRFGCKMATGSGKTVVMSMLLAWSFCNRGAQPSDTRFPSAALVLAPNLTIHDRLQVLRPDHEDNYYQKFNLVPGNLGELLKRGRVLVHNWHKLFPEGEGVEGGQRFAVVKKGEESHEAFARRILGDLYDRGEILVLNDEGHHAYRPCPLSGDEKISADLRDERQEATVWIEGIDRIHAASGVRVCVDLSATPFYIGGSGYVEGSPFPWLVSDFGLMDAIESGIVKIPRVPVSDTTGLPEAKYYDLWKHISADLRAGQKASGGGPKPEVVWERANDALLQLAGQYTERFGYTQKSEAEQSTVPPVMIVVCDNTQIANAFFEGISGEHPEDVEITVASGKNKGEKKIVKKNQFGRGKVFPELFSNTAERQTTLRVDSRVFDEFDASGEETRDEAKARLREMVGSVGQRGKAGEQVRCVVSVQMLTEGWDANNVTHILGLRAFGSQLLIEQVVGRGLRRMSYEPDPVTGLLPPEYVDVYGIPFSLIPVKGRAVGQAAPEDKPIHTVRAMEERSQHEIRFPVVEDYVFDMKDNQIRVNFDTLEPLLLEPMRTPTATFVQPQIGGGSGIGGVNDRFDFEVHDRNAYYESVHLQTIQFEIARQVLINLTLGRNSQQPKMLHQARHQLFPQVFAIVERYVREKINFNGAPPQEIGVERYANRIIERLTEAIEPNEESGEPPMLPQLDRYKPISSTAEVYFQTQKPVRQIRKSHLNLLVSDTERWEQSAGFFLEASPQVVSFVKNDHLDLAIPYVYEGVPAFYEPDFLVKLVNGLTLVLEIKGQEREREPAKHQGARTWVKAVNNWGKLGRWDFAVCRNVAELPALLSNLRT